MLVLVHLPTGELVTVLDDGATLGRLETEEQGFVAFPSELSLAQLTPFCGGRLSATGLELLQQEGAVLLPLLQNHVTPSELPRL